MLDRGRNCWRIERANRASVIVDAAAYFQLARQAMLSARSQILMIGWDFDTRICLDYEAQDEAPSELGEFLSWLPKHRPGLQIHILKWDLGSVQLLGRGTTILRLLRWATSKQIHFKLDGAHPPGASHHQKIVVIDDSIAFCGGIDMTGSRWDTREHLDCDERRRRPTTGRRYAPWHDATMAVDGPAAAAMGDLARDRWKAAGGGELSKVAIPTDTWPTQLHPQFEDVDVAIARTRGATDELEPVREIEALFADMIREANHFVYAESQYLASRLVADAIAERLVETDGPEFVIINPKTGEGWLDDEIMSPARAQVIERLRSCDRNSRFRIYSPVTEGGEDIYVHSKIMIVDDRQLRVGSANLNNRSLGLDSECDLLIDASLEGNERAAGAIHELRIDLLSEHLGISVDQVESLILEKGSMVKAIDGLISSLGRGLFPLVSEHYSRAARALARTEALDPESAGKSFEPIARPGLLARMSRRRPLGEKARA